MDPKPWYTSKTIWFNILFALTALAGLFGFADYQATPTWAEAVAVGVSAVNILIRWAGTRQPIG